MLSNSDTQEECLDPKIRLLSYTLNVSLFLSLSTDLVVKI